MSNNCNCKDPIIKCDDRGCHCASCGGYPRSKVYNDGTWQEWDAVGHRQTPAAQMLREAAGLIDGHRNNEHGNRHLNFDNIASTWTGYLKPILAPGAALTSEHVGWMLAMMKACRAQNGLYNRDDYVDGAAYIALAGDVAAYNKDNDNGC